MIMVDITKLNHIPDLLALHQHKPDIYPYLLSSADCGGEQARYSILFAFPQQKLNCFSKDDDAFFSLLDSLKQTQQALPTFNGTELPFLGGWFFYFSYEYAQCIEQHLTLNTSGLPLAFARRIPAGYIIDHKQQCAYSFCEEKYKHYKPALLTDSTMVFEQQPYSDLSAVLVEDDELQYLDAVHKAKKYIRDGDIFQANLSREWSIPLAKPLSAEHCFYQLMQQNPSPFSALVNINNDFTIVSSSPERLIKMKYGRIESRPIAGTHPRSNDTHHDQRLSLNLLNHPKEQAEHIMLIDLVRNDLGRFCVPGSIKVDEMMVLESYRHVHHIVSNIVGDIAPNTSLKDIIHAVFPGGTITGCPKVRCMEIINELERSERGCYTGSVGYVNHNGDGDFNILIRTLMHHKQGISFRAGAGIVADSVADNELNETRHKAKGMIRAFS